MLCPICLSKTQITNSRKQLKTLSTWRRHSCLSCPNVFTTIESIDLSTTHKVVKLNGDYENFSWLKLYVSIHKSLDHRSTAPDDANNITNTITANLIRLRNKLIDTETIISIAMKTLGYFDPAAAIKYQTMQTPIMNKRDVQKALKR